VLTTEIARMSGFANDDFLGVLSGTTLPESSSVLETVWKGIERRQLTAASEATRWNPDAEKGVGDNIGTDYDPQDKIGTISPIFYTFDWGILVC
jgi:hypothetical protein